MDSKRVGNGIWAGDVTDPGRVNLFEEYRRLLEDTTTLLGHKGIPFIPYANPMLLRFRKLTQQKQLDGVSSLRNYVEVLRAANTDAAHGTNQYTVKSFLNKQGWKIEADALNLINDDIMVEIYDRDSHQVYRNAGIFPLISISLEELCSAPWFELWERETKITTYMLELVGMILKGELTGCMSYLTPRHEVREAKRRLEVGAPMGPLFVSPLYHAHGEENGTVAGYLSAFRTF